MIEFKKIQNSSEPLFINMYELYQTAFPPVEQRTLEDLKAVLNYEKHFESYALLKENKFVGFFNYWIFDSFIYVEHFAVNEILRKQNIGSDAMKRFLSKIDLPVVLEVEPPNDANSIRRIKFYNQFGFEILSHAYLQPYYDGSGKLFPLLIMSNNYHFADTHFTLIRSTLYRDVYRYFQNNEKQLPIL